MESVLEIAKINLKVNARNSVFMAAALCILVPFFVGTANLDGNSAAIPLEMFVSLTGIVLLTPVFAPEQNVAVCDLVSSKYLDTAIVYVIRVVYSIALIAALVGLSGMYMRMRSCDVTLLLVLGTTADAVFLGALGMFTSSVSGNTVIGYMMPVLYYAVNIGMGSRLGKFYLFSMTLGEYGTKLWLFLAGIVLMVGAIAYQIIQKRMR